MLNYDWPGNIRELENLIERLVTLSVSGKIKVSDLPEYLCEKKKAGPDNLKLRVQDVETEHIRKILEQTNWKKNKAAEILGISAKYLWEKMKKYNIE